MIISAAVITIILSLILTIVYWRVNKNILFLFVFILALNLMAILHNLMFYNGSVLATAVLYNHFVPLFFLAGPMLFFYVRSVLKDNDRLTFSSFTDYLHFFPSILGLVGIMPYLFLPFQQKLMLVEEIVADPHTFKTTIANWILPPSVNSVLRPLLLIIYALLSFRMLYRFNSRSASYFSPNAQRQIAMRWLFGLVTITMIIASIYLVLVILFFTVPHIELNSPVVFSTSALIGALLMFIPAMLMVFPQLMYGIPRGQVSSEGDGVRQGVISMESFSGQIAESNRESLEERASAEQFVEAKAIGEHEPFLKKARIILAYIEEKKPYLHPDFNIEMLSESLNIPRNHIYYCFNNILNEKFTDLRMRLRVEHAKNLIISGEADNITMEGIASISGFPSRSRFFTSFKAHTGLTPREFLDQQQ